MSTFRRLLGSGDDRRPRFGVIAAAFFAPWLPALAMTPAFRGPPRFAALILGVLATVLAGVGIGSNHFRNAAAVTAACVALAPFVVPMTFIPRAVMVVWGIVMFFLMAGPFGHEPLVSEDGVHWHEPGASAGQSHVPSVS